MAYSKIILNGETLMDVTSDTVDAGNLLSGKTATKNSGAKVTGNIATKSSSDLTVSGATVTAPAGYYSATASKAVATTTHPNPTATIASSTGVVTASHTQGTGYVTGGTTTGTLNLTTQAAQTINTSTADQTIASNRWLTGTQTIKSVTTTNLTAANIAEGVTVKVGDSNNASRITQITGTHSGETQYTATITNSGNATYCYVSYGGTKYYSNNGTFSFKAGDTLTIYCRGNDLLINGEEQALTSYSYTMTLPIGDIYIQFAYTSSTVNGIYIDTYIKPEDTYEISSSGTFNVYGYAQAWVPSGETATPAKTITTNPTMTLASTTGVVTATYNGSSSITPTIVSGYVTASTTTAGIVSTTGTSTFQLTSKAATTYNTSTADQTVPSYRWLTGTQTIKSVTTSNLTAANIASGVVIKVGDANNASRITQVTGTYTGGTQRTFTITGTGNSTACYIQHNNIKYYSAGSFLFKSGDIANLYVYGNSATFKYASVIINGVSVHGAYSTYSSAYTLPDCNITANLLANSEDCGLSMNYSTIDISESGGYDVCDYGWANVNISTTPMPYYSIYQVLATSRHLSVNNYSDIQEWANSYSEFSNMQFAGLTITGSVTFNNIKSDFGRFGVFGSVSCGLRSTTFDGLASYNFPELSYGIGQGWFYNNCNIKSINAPKCKFIGSSAFYNCFILEDVSIPSCISIFDNAFQMCTLLSSVNFPSCTWVRSSAFCACTGLQTANFPACTKLNNYAFQTCTSLSSISFPNCSMIGAYAFGACRTLTIADFPNCSYIESSAFCSCSGLTTAIFPSCQIISSSAFCNCYMLSNISFPLCSTIGSGAFQNCSSLITVSFSNCSIIGMSAFSKCSNLTSVNIPNCSSIGAYAFQSCYNLTTINATACQSVGGNAFEYCSSLTAINLQSCSFIGTYTFQYCRDLSIVSIPICRNIPNYTFRGCYNLISLYLNSVSSVPSLGTGAFASTPISTYSASAGRYGSIFVPTSLYNDFITHASWKAYSARIVSV